MRRVVNCHYESYDVLIDRTTKWGNPFWLAKDATEEERLACIAKYKKWIPTQKHLVYAIKAGELRGKKVGCHCWPKACHGDVLIELDDYYAQMEELFGREEILKETW